MEFESQPAPQAAEVIPLKGDTLPISTLLPLREMAERGHAVDPKAGVG